MSTIDHDSDLNKRLVKNLSEIIEILNNVEQALVVLNNPSTELPIDSSSEKSFL